MGLIAVFIIYWVKWNEGQLLVLSESMSLLALIFYCFISNGQMTWIGFTNANMFLAVLQRISKVLQMEEHQRSVAQKTSSKKVEIIFENSEFTWGFRVNKEAKVLEQTDSPALQDITFELNSGQKLVVIGSVGSGKTTLLHSIMGETCSKSPESSTINGTIAYVEQEPFILSDSVKNNVTFGREFDKTRFDEALRVS